MIKITLDQDDWAFAAAKGARRHVDGIMKKRFDPRGLGSEQKIEVGFFWNINGASGEKCVANWLGIPWDGTVGIVTASDVGVLEVRTTPGHNYPLRLHPEGVDKGDRIYVLVTGIGPTWRIQGYMLCKEGRREEWWSDRPPPVRKKTGRPAFWVPQEYINHDLDALYARHHSTKKQAPIIEAVEADSDNFIVPF
jgi:hypothetical protein